MNTAIRAMTLMLLVPWVGLGCGSEAGGPDIPSDVIVDAASDASEDTAMAAPSDVESEPQPDILEEAELAKRCDYNNAFTGEPECKAYTGVDWTTESSRTDCELNIPGGGGVFFVLHPRRQIRRIALLPREDRGDLIADF